MPAPHRAAPWQDIEIPSKVAAIPGMLTSEERRYYIWLTSTQFQGRGAIVDLGPFLGLSTACLAEGLARNDKTGEIHSYDLFEWRRNYMPKACDLDLADGDDFMPQFWSNVAPWSGSIQASKQDLTDYEWTGGPIELLIVDAAKNWDLTNGILRSFGDALIPGFSRVVFQDFREPTCYWLSMVVDSRPDLWDEKESTLESTTVTFTTKRPLLDSGGITDYAPDSFDPEEGIRILFDRLRHDPPGTHSSWRSMLYCYLLIAAERVGQELIENDSWVDGEQRLAQLRASTTSLLGPGWDAHQRRDHATALEFGTRCVRVLPDHVGALCLVACAALSTGDRERARAVAERMTRSDPDDPAGKLIHIQADFDDGRIDDAARAIGVLRADPGLANSHRAAWIDNLAKSIEMRRGEHGTLDPTRSS